MLINTYINKLTNKLHYFINKTRLCRYPFIMTVEYTEIYRDIQRIYRDIQRLSDRVLLHTLQSGTSKVIINVNLHI